MKNGNYVCRFFCAVLITFEFSHVHTTRITATSAGEGKYARMFGNAFLTFVHACSKNSIEGYLFGRVRSYSRIFSNVLVRSLPLFHRTKRIGVRRTSADLFAPQRTCRPRKFVVWRGRCFRTNLTLSSVAPKSKIARMTNHLTTYPRSPPTLKPTITEKM